MPQVHFVKKARKSNKKLGIIRGLPYWWWTGPKPRVHGKRGRRIVSLTNPRPSQVTSNPYLKRCLTIKESVEAASKNGGLREALTQASDDFKHLEINCRERLANMPDSLQESATGELLKERAERCDSLSDRLLEAASEETIEIGEALSGINWEF